MMHSHIDVLDMYMTLNHMSTRMISWRLMSPCKPWRKIVLVTKATTAITANMKLPFFCQRWHERSLLQLITRPPKQSSIICYAVRSLCMLRACCCLVHQDTVRPQPPEVIAAFDSCKDLVLINLHLQARLVHCDNLLRPQLLEASGCPGLSKLGIHFWCQSSALSKLSR